MVGGKRTERDERRRSLGQNFLTSSSVVQELLARIELTPSEHVVEFGAGRGALTIPLARSGARITAVEVDPVWTDRLRRLLRDQGLEQRVKVVRTELRRFRLPSGAYRWLATCRSLPPLTCCACCYTMRIEVLNVPTYCCNGRSPVSARCSRRPLCCLRRGHLGGPSRSGQRCLVRPSAPCRGLTAPGWRSASVNLRCFRSGLGPSSSMRFGRCGRLHLGDVRRRCCSIQAAKHCHKSSRYRLSEASN